MKYIIDLPEAWYKQIKDESLPMGKLEYLVKETATPLDSFIEGIKGEIETRADDYLSSGSYDGDLYNGAYRDALYWCFDLLEKHIEEGDKE